MYFCVVLCIVCFVSFSVLFVFICVLNYCYRVATQLQLNISYHKIAGIVGRSGVRTSVGARYFSLKDKTDSGAHPALVSTGVSGGVKRPGACS